MDATFDGESIREFVSTFYARVRRHPDLAPVFAREVDDWTDHEERLVVFWSTVLLARKGYKGNPLAVHERLPDLTAEHFRAWLELFEETASGFFAPEAAAELSRQAHRMGQHLQARLGIRATRSAVAAAMMLSLSFVPATEKGVVGFLAVEGDARPDISSSPAGEKPCGACKVHR